jgi:glycosyltransferase involved in cell wall biosynthesis
MLVLHILTGRADDRAASYAAELIRGLHAADLKQSVIMDARAPHYKAIEKAGIEMAPGIVSAHGQWRRRLLLRRLISRLKPDAIHCWTHAATRLVSSEKIRMIVWLGGRDDPDHFASNAHFVAATTDIAAHLVRQNVARARVRFMPVFSALSTAPPVDRNLLATPRDAKALVNFSPLHPAARLDVLLTALRDLPGCYLWLAGTGPLRHALEAQAAEKDVVDRVRFVKAMDRAALLRAADLCVLPAPDEPLGTIVQDAWMSGTPLVAGGITGFLSPFEDNVEGKLVEAGDAIGLARAISDILDNEDLRGRLIAQGYATGLNFYARETVIRRWVEFYREISANN